MLDQWHQDGLILVVEDRLTVAYQRDQDWGTLVQLQARDAIVGAPASFQFQNIDCIIQGVGHLECEFGVTVAPFVDRGSPHS
jgi:hypothetical protein